MKILSVIDSGNDYLYFCDQYKTNKMAWIYFVISLISQTLANILFRYGTLKPEYDRISFIIGCISTFIAMWVMMQLFKYWAVPLVIGACGGGGFIIVQLVLAGVFKSPLNVLQVFGIFVIALGICIVAYGSGQNVQDN